MKILLDECCSIQFPFLTKRDSFVDSRLKVGAGASDREVFDYAESVGLPIETQDKKFAFNILLKSKPVIYEFKDGRRLKMDVILTDLGHVAQFCHDKRAEYLLINESIIIP